MRLTSYIYETCDKVIPTWSITQESIFTLAWRWNRSTIARSVLVVSWWMLSIYRHSAFWTSPRNTFLGTSWNAKNGCLVSSNHWTLWILMKLQQKNHATSKLPVFTRCSSSLGLWFGDEGGDGMGWSHIGYTLKVGRGQHELQDEQRVQSFIVMVDGHFSYEKGLLYLKMYVFYPWKTLQGSDPSFLAVENFVHPCVFVSNRCFGVIR